MHTLASLQGALRHAIAGAGGEPVVPGLRGGTDPQRRLEIHRRHYHASLTGALMQAYPATRWLCGDGPVAEAAAAFVRVHPPVRPCMAEYGAEFPALLASRPWAATLWYLHDFAALEWLAGRAALAVSEPPLDWPAIAARGPVALQRSRAVLQSGLHYLKANSPVDDLLRHYLAGEIAERFELEERRTWIEVRGARGALHLSTLDRGDWLFRREVQAGATLAEAAARALDAVPETDIASALVSLATAGLVTQIIVEPAA